MGTPCERFECHDDALASVSVSTLIATGRVRQAGQRSSTIATRVSPNASHSCPVLQCVLDEYDDCADRDQPEGPANDHGEDDPDHSDRDYGRELPLIPSHTVNLPVIGSAADPNAL
jgi:hypothetical protein